MILSDDNKKDAEALSKEMRHSTAPIKRPILTKAAKIIR